MNFKRTDDISGTYLVGSMDITYPELKKTLGKPDDGDGYKVDAEWNIISDTGIVATIYNYKDGRSYNGSSGLPKTKITEWHIGGVTSDAIDFVKSLFPKANVRPS